MGPPCIGGRLLVVCARANDEISLVDDTRLLVDDSRPLVHGKILLVDDSRLLVHDKILLVDDSRLLVHDKILLVDDTRPLVHGKILLVDDSRLLVHDKILVDFDKLDHRASDPRSALAFPSDEGQMSRFGIFFYSSGSMGRQAERDGLYPQVAARGG